MAKKNEVVKTNTAGAVCEYEANGEKIKLSPQIIRQYLVNGNSAVTDAEVMMFLMLCKGQHLNPFLREAYLIKYGNAPATIIVGKDVHIKRACRNERFAGMQAGVTVISKDGQRLIEREGTLTVDGEQLVGGWAKVYVKGYEHPVYSSVSMREYSSGKSNWASNAKPATMIRKVALSQALREAFPEDLQGLYGAEEMSTVNKAIDIVEVTENAQNVEPPYEKEQAVPEPEAPAEEVPPVEVPAEVTDADFEEVGA